MLTTAALKSGRVLSNPDDTTKPYIGFLQQVCERFASLRENNEEDTLQILYNYVRLFALGVPNKKGEPVPGPGKVCSS